MAQLISFFLTGGVVLKFFSYIGKIIFVKGLILPFQFAVLGFVIVTRIAIVSMLFVFAIKIFNSMHELFDKFNNMNIVDSTIYEVPFKLLYNFGFFSALQEHLPLISLCILTYFLVVLSRLTLDTFRLIADELFKIGLLTTN